MKTHKKIPLQIYLDPGQEKIIGILAKESGKSRAAIIRSCISELIASLPPERDPVLGIINLGASGRDNIAEKHDEYLISSKKKGH
jgi:hypothetical protein